MREFRRLKSILHSSSVHHPFHFHHHASLYTSFSPHFSSLFFALIIMLSITNSINTDAPSLNFRANLVNECQTHREVVCIGLNDMNGTSVDDNSNRYSNCFDSGDCNVFAVFRISHESLIHDELHMSLYRFGARPTKKIPVSLKISYNGSGTRYDCKYIDDQVKSGIKVPPNSYKMTKSGHIDSDLFGCHWIINQRTRRDLWPKYGSKPSRIPLITENSVSFELRSLKRNHTVDHNVLQLYTLQHLKGVKCELRSRFCYHWKEFENTWLLIDHPHDAHYIQVLIIIPINYSTIELKFSHDTLFGDDFAVTCHRSSQDCRSSMFHLTHTYSRKSVLHEVEFHSDQWLHRIFFKIPLIFAINNCTFSLLEPFYVNFKLTRNSKTDSLWLPSIVDLDLQEMIKHFTTTTVKPPPGIPIAETNNQYRIAGRSCSSSNHQYYHPSILIMGLIMMKLCLQLLFVRL